MFKRIVITVVPGIVSSVLVNSVLRAWSDVGPGARLFMSFVFGLVVLLFVVFLARRSEAETNQGGTRVATNIDAKGDVDVNHVTYTGKQSSSLDVLTDFRSQGDVKITDVNVQRGVSSDGNSGRS